MIKVLPRVKITDFVGSCIRGTKGNVLVLKKRNLFFSNLYFDVIWTKETFNYVARCWINGLTLIDCTLIGRENEMKKEKINNQTQSDVRIRVKNWIQTTRCLSDFGEGAEEEK